MSTRPQHGGRRRILAPAAAVLGARPPLALALVLALVLGVVGAVVLVLALRAPAIAPPAAPDRTATDARAVAPSSGGGPSSGTGSGTGSATGSGTDTGTATGAAPADAAGPAAATSPTDSAPDLPPGPAPELGPVLPASDPVSLAIPSIGVARDVLEPLALDVDGVLPAPEDYALPGWYTGGPRPGQLGPAVIAGHVDGPDGPAVFYRLGELAVGATVDIGRADGSVARFVVDAVERYAKADFPTSRVYGNTTDRAEIRLITCGGVFDRTTGHYVDNIVVFGHLVA